MTLKSIGMLTFTAALFTTAQMWKQADVHRQVNRYRERGTYVHTRWNVISLFKTGNSAIRDRMNLEDIMLRKVRAA